MTVHKYLSHGEEFILCTCDVGGSLVLDPPLKEILVKTPISGIWYWQIMLGLIWG